MEEAAERGKLPAAFLQDAEGAGMRGITAGCLHIELREPEIPVRLSRLPHAHDELRLFQYLAFKQNKPKGFGKGLIGFSKDIEKNLLAASSLFVFSTERAQRPEAAQAYRARQRHDRQLRQTRGRPQRQRPLSRVLTSANSKRS